MSRTEEITIEFADETLQENNTHDYQHRDTRARLILEQDDNNDNNSVIDYLHREYLQENQNLYLLSYPRVTHHAIPHPYESQTLVELQDADSFSHTTKQRIRALDNVNRVLSRYSRIDNDDVVMLNHTKSNNYTIMRTCMALAIVACVLAFIITVILTILVLNHEWYCNQLSVTLIRIFSLFFIQLSPCGIGDYYKMDLIMHTVMLVCIILFWIFIILFLLITSAFVVFAVLHCLHEYGWCVSCYHRAKRIVERNHYLYNE
jgi:hypothetical protein